MKNSIRSRISLVPMLIVGGLFFVFGFVTWLNGSLIPFLQIACELNHLEAYLVGTAFYISYTIMALPMSFVLQRTGYKTGLVLGLLIMALGAFIFVPAAVLRMYSIFLLALFVLGTGLTILQSATNPYLVAIGPEETAAVRISIMGVLNKSAGVVAPIVFTALAFTDMSQFSEARLAALNAAQKSQALADLSSRLVPPYLVMATILLLLAGLMRIAPLREPPTTDGEQETAAEETSVFRQPRLVLGAFVLFFYVGAEVIAGDTIGLFGKDLGLDNFGQLTSYTMAFMVIGYIVGMILIPRWISQQQALAASAVLGILLSLVIINANVDANGLWATAFFWTGVPAIPDVVLYVALFGLANAMVWPALWPMALHGLTTKQIHTGSALLIMGIAGGAVIPLVYGAVGESLDNLQSAYAVMIPCYMLILFYAVIAHRLKQR